MNTPRVVSESDFPHVVLRDAGVGVLTTDTSGRITYANPWAERLLGRPAHRMTGRDLHDLLHRRADGSALPRSQCPLLTPLDRAGAAAAGSEDHFLRSDGSVMPIHWAATALREADRTVGLVVAFSDYSAQREAEERTAAHTAALEALTDRLHLMEDASEVLMSGDDSPGRIRRLLRLLVPMLGEWAAVDLYPEEDGALERVAVRSGTHPRRASRLEGPLPPGAVPAGGLRGREDEPVRIDARDLRAAADGPLAVAYRPLFDELGGRTAVSVPLRARRRSYGLLTVARTAQAPAHTDEEVRLLTDLGRRLALVLDNVRLYNEQRDVSETMQRQLLTPLPQVDHLRMAARYVPAQSALEVGGDWYDAFLLKNGVMALVIGDVVGHDLEAASHMAEVRNMLRAVAWDRQEPPSGVVHGVDDAVTNTSDAPMATLVFARIEGPEGGPWQLHWSNAGHPPPLLIAPDGGTRYLTGGHGPLIGMNAALHLGLTWPDARQDLPPGSTLLLYTDGLVESRGRPIDLGMATLRHHASMLARHTVDDFCDALLDRIAPSGDDTALLAVRVPEAGMGAPGDRRPPPPPQSPYSPAAPHRAAPGSTQEHPRVQDPTHPADDGRQEPG
ncbi:SpoIIE family protein phosphatase [Streptomyces sp. enrichment culture]|uniref:SpoIIE family protein phosphatase n=1 Tax=Streptomyces sp. enrichment culture TaxID=1795815 RepID=UPI003F56C310